MEPTHILFEKADGVATITLNRPDKLNAFAGNMREELLGAVMAGGRDKDVRVLVITGAGKAFCAGGDVNELAAGTNAKPAGATNERYTMSKIVLEINSMEKPVIASVNGAAVGGGCNLALACDIRIASELAKFGEAFTKRGVHPDWGGIYLLPRLVGYAKAAELIFSGDLVDAREALRIGLVNRVVPHDTLRAATQELALRIARNAPLPVALAKRGLQRFYEMDLAQAVDYEAFALSICASSEDMKEGFKAFLEKREPEFVGR
ncbi:MAG: putative enoyl-CoA hydratase echA8 [Syntrophorhabdus sp. PtaU1.Bin058]|nr:MAG: putative enoyl-CoA hydratase echA8 [Syntrophorhabdus sp. PtaU1.Bin058]